MKEPTSNTASDSDASNLHKQVNQNQQLLEEIYRTVEKTRKYFLATVVINIVVFVLPLIIALIVVPAFLDNYLNYFQI